ncbi:MAG: hypothetical protein QNJ42_21665 [Crocosphaera sp.]|nr:hypothetical protein [Crocosphaera sp.]
MRITIFWSLTLIIVLPFLLGFFAQLFKRLAKKYSSSPPIGNGNGT